MISTKFCNKCHTELPLDMFYSNGKICKNCYSFIFKEYAAKNKDKIREKSREYYKNNIDKIKKYNKEYAAKNKDEFKKYSKKYNLKNKDKIREKSREYYKNNIDKFKEHNKKYYLNNKNKIRKYNKGYRLDNKDEIKKQKEKYRLNNKDKIREQKNEYSRNKRKTNLNFKLKGNLSRRILQALKRNLKSASTIELLGCTVPELKIHLENKFKEGMTWENHGLYGWHIDHIIPCSSFDLSKPEEQRKCFHYSNLQPLWAKDNLTKGNKLIAVTT